MQDLSIDRLVPHRERMRLIDHIVAVDEDRAITESVITDQWPLTTGGRTSTLVLIELVAQTASVHIGCRDVNFWSNNVYNIRCKPAG